MARQHYTVILFIVLMLLAYWPGHTAEAQTPGCVRVSLRSDLLTMNPFLQSLTDESAVMQLVFDTLYRQAPNGSFVPWLAERVEVRDNGTVWIFHLKKGVKWHDGSELTAEDVAYTFNLTMKYKFPRRANVWEPLQEVWVIDDYTVGVKLRYPYAGFDAALSWLFIVQKKQWEKVQDPMTYSNFDNPIGSGPFRWKERRAGDYIVLERNPDYWAGAPRVECIVFKIYKSSDAAYMAALKGEIDAMNILFVPPHLVSDAMKKAQEDPALEVHIRKPVYFQYITFKITRYPFNVKEFREAMLYAIDVNKIVQVVYEGHADPGSLGTMPPVFNEMPGKWYRPGLEKERLYPFNITKAKEILDRLGFVDRDGDGVRETGNGTKLEFDLLVSSIYPDRVRIAEMVKDWFSQAGMRVNVKVLDHRTVVAKLLEHDFDLVLIGIWLTEPDDWYLILHSSSAVKGGFNSAEYTNPEVDRLLELQRTTLDVEKRREILWKLQEAVARDIPYIPLVHIHEAYVYRTDRFTGWVLSPIMMPASFWSFMSLEPATAKPTATSPPPTTPGATQTTPATQTSPEAQTTTQTQTLTPAAGASPSTATILAAVVVALAVAAGVVYMARRR